MADKLQFVKDNVKVSVTVVAFGLALTLGYAKGCSVGVDSEKSLVPSAPVPVVAPVVAPVPAPVPVLPVAGAPVESVPAEAPVGPVPAGK